LETVFKSNSIHKMSFDQSFKYLLQWEGGYSNDPGDDGGPTKFGVIQAEYNNARIRKGLPLQSVRFITKEEAAEIYQTEYWQPLHCDKLNPGVANTVFDSGVNSGIGRGALWLQQAVNYISGKIIIPEDGMIGPATIYAANQLSADALIDRILAIRLEFLHRAHNREGQALWPIFGRGWQTRIIGVRTQSHHLAGLPLPEPESPFILEINFGEPLEKLTMENIIFGLLSNAQIQSIIRSALKVGGATLFAKAGLDPSTLDGFIGLVFTGLGLVQSALHHASTPVSINPAPTA
jgi:lysozyme family protein